MMKNTLVFYFCLLITGICSIFSAVRLEAKSPHDKISSHQNGFHGRIFDSPEYHVVPTPTDGGITEIVPDKYRAKYDKWKEEFLSTDYGRRQWEAYSANKNFILKIKISGAEGQGGGTTDYLWDDAGNLVGATILLGSQINKGYPSPVYYPVLNSLSITNSLERDWENVLAAVKIAHEFGHVNNTSKLNGEDFRQQNNLIVEYNKIFFSNRYNVKEPRLVKLEKELGGTPLDVWANREYWGENSSMLYLLDRLKGGKVYCSVLDRIENNIKEFAISYEDRFSPVFTSSKICQN